MFGVNDTLVKGMKAKICIVLISAQIILIFPVIIHASIVAPNAL